VLSGQVPPVIDATADRASIAAYGDTATQTVGVLHKSRRRSSSEALAWETWSS
jgi:hypothetical protein